MAGIEEIVVHSKSYIVRWIQVSELHSISWSLQPHKRSINFGIFKHPGTKNGLAPVLPTHETVEPSPSMPGTPALEGEPQLLKRGRQGSIGRNEQSRVVEKLESLGLKNVAWAGRCDADKVSMGRYDVQKGEGGMYGLVFDNTFSKQTSKTVHFVVMTHPTSVPPKSGHHLHYSQAFATRSSGSVGKSYSPSLQPATDSNESLPQTGALHRAVLEDPRPLSKGGRGVESKGPEGASFYTGVLNKKRRKRGQGYAKRFFSLDFTTSTLSYYRDRHSSALRGAVPLSLAAVGVNGKTREFSVDSGAEVWHLKALNKKDFEGWRNALERASSAVNPNSTPATPAKALCDLPKMYLPNAVEDREWERIEQLVSKVSGTRDAVRGLAKDTELKSPSNGPNLSLTHSGGSSDAPSPSSYESANPYFPEVDENGQQQRRPFWKRKPSIGRSPVNVMRRSVSAQLAVLSNAPTPLSPSPGSLKLSKRASAAQQTPVPTDNVHGRCMALLRDLDNVVSEFAALVAESKARRIPPLTTSVSRTSLDSVDQEFFDAEDGGKSPSQLLHIRRGEDEEAHEEQLFDHASEIDSDTSSEAGDGAALSSILTSTPQAAQDALFPSLPQALPPLPLPAVKRRATVPPPKQPPPSIIGFLRKNAGKDLSTVSMPVTANEPTSLLQRLSESMEYSHLLDSAASSSIQPSERLMYVTAFAISYFASSRIKERAVRKPFNPMLGETFELVREDLGFRFIAEKVSHHPVRMACQAESLNNGGWCFTQSPQPVQKFWGKSVELNTEGRARVILHAPNERYSWNQATCFLRNVIAGEKYVEPVQSMTVLCESNGLFAVATFKSGGMFSGRSEEVSVQLFDPTAGGAPLPLGLTGKWTESLKRTDTDNTVWTVGSVVSDAPKVYGFTTFAAALNEITDIEDEHLAPTDSRLRPDQQALEIGDVDRAEAMKAHLEERQRSRRKVLESHGQTWQPQFFEKVTGGQTDVKEGGDEEVWMLKTKRGYWERRATRDWEGVQEVFDY